MGVAGMIESDISGIYNLSLKGNVDNEQNGKRRMEI